ncbi:MAG: hypothetical protein E7486_00550 [Ruminococcaceae bacterium]|nr:hypothetical protein [Oscillospiraceae bacterium]
MDRYRRLFSNTVLFAIGTLGSKVLVFLILTPLYTHFLSPEEFGIANMIIQAATLIFPITSLTVVNAVIRFGMDRAYPSRDVYSIAFWTVVIGSLLLLPFLPLLQLIPYLSGYVWIICLYVPMAALRQITAAFVKTREYIRLYAVDGILTTLLIIVFTAIFLVGLNMGLVGYILAIILSDLCSVLFLGVIARIDKYIKVKGIRRGLAKSMLRYSIPFIPNATLWWITNMSDQYIITYMIDPAVGGLYSTGYKIPTMLTIASTIFYEAWQVSSITEKDSPTIAQFFNKTFSCLQALVFIGTSGIILCAKWLTDLLVSDEFFSSWEYIPFLVLATAFSCFVNFLGSIYVMEKKSTAIMISTVFGAVLNIIMNLILIPLFGAQGAAFATFLSYLIVFIYRSVSVKKEMPVRFNTPKLLVNLILLLVQSLLMIFEVPGWVWWQLGGFGLIVAINAKDLIKTAQRLLRRPAKKEA